MENTKLPTRDKEGKLLKIVDILKQIGQADAICLGMSLEMPVRSVKRLMRELEERKIVTKKGSLHPPNPPIF